MEIQHTMKISHAVLAVTAVGGLVWFSVWAFKSGDGEPKSSNVIVSHGGKDGKATKPDKLKKKKPGKPDAEKPPLSKLPPVFNIDDEDNLNEEQKKLLARIREALDNNDKKTVIRLVQKMQKSDEWPDGIPKAVKMAAIEAMGWFGVECLPEVLGFLADSDHEVVELTLERLQEAVSDITISDRERAKILVELGKVVPDADTMDTMLFELNNMRHSVAAAAIKELMATGNDATKQALPDNVEFVTGEENINTPGKIDKWLAQNPDDEDDEELYGGDKD